MAASFIRYVWNAVAGRFISPGGQFVSFASVRSDLDRALDGASQDAAAIANLYASGTIGVAEFENRLQALIKETQLYSSAVAAGGFANIDAAALDVFQQRLAEQFTYLSDWMDDLAAGTAQASRGMAQRAGMYAQSARNTFDVTYRAGQALRGFDEERNILNPGESCDLCREQTALGWVPIGTLIPVGQRTCISNCNCVVNYRSAA